ncbi:MAG: hypothetical protein AAGC88_09225 [Bacteroidota bacterium]
MASLHKEFMISPARGFLPDNEPLVRLPRYYVAWDELGYNLPEIITADLLSQEVAKLPMINTDKLGSHLAYERAMLVLSYISHAYLNDPAKPQKRLPEVLAVPWVEVAKRLDRPPVLSHASAVLHNWTLIYPDQPIALNNLAILQQYRGGVDEAWFFLVTVMIEFEGALIIKALITLYEQHQPDQETLKQLLKSIAEGIDSITHTLGRMPERCDPYVFYHQTRPFLATLQDIEYAGAHSEPQTWFGGSAAQSSLIQALDIGFAVVHEEKHSAAFLKNMRTYMPQPHRFFLEYLETVPSIPDLLSKSSVEEELTTVRKKLLNFRKGHLKIFHRYIASQSKKAGPGDKGTGGTDASVFLKQLKSDTESK